MGDIGRCCATGSTSGRCSQRFLQSALKSLSTLFTNRVLADHARRLSILFTNNTLSLRAGSELWVRDVCCALVGKGHCPIAFSLVTGEIAEETGETGEKRHGDYS